MLQQFETIYCVIKISGYEYHQLNEGKEDLFFRLTPDRQEGLKKSHDLQKAFVDDLKKISTDLGLSIHFINEREMSHIHPSEDDLVLSCGGDGTFLSCAQKYQDSTLLGLNSDFHTNRFQGSYGALTSVNRINIKNQLVRLVQEKFQIAYWNRLQIKINGELVDRLAVNDVFIGNPISYETCDLSLSVDGEEENFLCSGLITCTGMGSHAWYYNAGGSPFSNELDGFGFRVLIPNIKRALNYSSGVVTSNHELVVCPNRDGYIVSFDSRPDVITTHIGDEIRIILAKDNPVKVITFPKDHTWR